MELTRTQERELNNLRYEATDKCFKSALHDHSDIMKKMIEKAYLAGMATGSSQQREISRDYISRIMVPEEI